MLTYVFYSLTMGLMGTSSQIPERLDWVEKRAACSAAQVFKELQIEIEGDVAAANKANTLPGPFMATVTPDGHTLIVSFKNEVGPRIVFFVANSQIQVKDEKRNQKITASLTLNLNGRCVLKVDGVELEKWQFRKVVLEDFFFGEE